MIESVDQWRPQIERAKRIADMLSSGHAALFERFSRYALLLDLSILVLSAWLAALAFANEELIAFITPPDIKPMIWLGVLGVSCFCLSLIQLMVNWKGRADAHKRSLDLYCEVKREAGQLLSSADPVEESDARSLLARYAMASSIGTTMPEREFLRQKRSHKLKVAISKELDHKPSVSIALLRLKLWLKDNFGSK